VPTNLRSRIIGVGGNQAAAIGHYHPSAQIPGGMQAPMVRVIVSGDRVQVHQAMPLYADPNGAPIPATAPGNWFQLYAAGRA
jgi:hypothetical protein